MTGVEYELLAKHKEIEKWKALYEAADRYIRESPCDPDITIDQLIAYNNLQELKKENGIVR